jgi:hypothetical protein
MRKKIFPIVIVIVLGLLVMSTVQAFASPMERTTQADAPADLAVKPTKKADDPSANAPGKTKGKNVNIKGIIASANAGSLVVTTDDGGSLTIVITADTRIQVPGLGKEAGVAALKPGLQVGVQATEKDGVLTARSIHVVPGKPVLAHHVGVVTDYQPGVSITIEDKDGVAFTYLLSPDAKILPLDRVDLLVAGAYVTVIAPRDVTTTDLVATGIVVHPAVPAGLSNPATP